jgi:hypothetical protein
MVMAYAGTPQEFYCDGILYENMQTAIRIVKKDWDMMFLFDGNEGVGKSTCAQQMALLVDPTFNISRICFTPIELNRSIKAATRYQAVVYDEAYTGLSSRDTMSVINKTLVKMFAEIRQKNLFIFVVMPTFFDLDKYMALWRSRALIHCYTAKDFERGYFGFYNIDRKKDLYILGKRKGFMATITVTSAGLKFRTCEPLPRYFLLRGLLCAVAMIVRVGSQTCGVFCWPSDT